MRRSRGLLAPNVLWDSSCLANMRKSVEDWTVQFPDGTAIPESLKTRTAGFTKLLAALDEVPADAVASILTLGLPEELTTQKGEFNAKAATKEDWETIGKRAGWGKV
jgi:hypothetical protein